MDTKPSLFALLFSACALAQASVLAQSDFELSDEGWGITGAPHSTCPVTQQGDFCGVPWWEGTYIIAPPGYGQTGFTAPGKFTGDLSAAYGGTLSFDMAATTAAPAYARAPLVTITNGSTYTFPDDVWGYAGATQELFLYYPVETSLFPGADWTHYDLPLVASAGWHVGTLFDPAFVSVPVYDRVATEDDMRAFLGNVLTLRVEALYQRFDLSRTYLDNVVLSAPDQLFVPEASLAVVYKL